MDTERPDTFAGQSRKVTIQLEPEVNNIISDLARAFNMSKNLLVQRLVENIAYSDDTQLTLDAWAEFRSQLPTDGILNIGD